MSKNYILCGVGGQGIVLASKLLSHCIMDKGVQVRTAETIGMAQKGGSVVTHLKMGDKLYSSLVPKQGADVVIAFEAIEALRNLSYLKEDGVMIVHKKVITPFGKVAQEELKEENIIKELKNKVKNLYVVDGEKIYREVKSYKAVNVMMVSMVCLLGLVDITIEELKNAIEKRINPKFHHMNINVVELCKKYKGEILNENEGRATTTYC